MEHKLKVSISFYKAIISGFKLFEIRKNDRKFKPLDILVLQEWDEKTKLYTGRMTARRVTYLTQFQQKRGYVVLGISIYPAEGFRWEDK